MKKQLLTVSIFLISFTAFFGVLAQGTTFNNYTGAWSNNSSWDGGWTDGSPAFTGLPETNGDITIHGQINVGTPAANQNLTFAANKDSYDFTVNDTLIVYGNVDFANKAMNLILGDGAVFIIFGNLDMNNRINISSGGTLVIQGTFSKSGSQGSFTGDGNVYAGGYSGDAQSTVDSDGDSSFTIDDLSDDGFEDIENFVDDVEAGGTDNPLPVELLYFEVSAESNATLNWATATEINNDHFTIERSEDGDYFYEIGEVQGNGNSNDVIEYSFSDKFVLASVEYYRLKQTDYNGVFEYFSTIRVETTTGNETSLHFSFYPTTVTNGYFKISSNKPFEIKELIISDISGHTVRSAQNLTTKDNALTFSTDISPLKKGIYFLKMTSTAGDTKSSRIIIK